MQNIQDYIDSGILEQYAFGELAPAEAAAVEAQASQHPTVREELDQIRTALGFYAEAHAVTPPAGMRERVLANVLPRLEGAAPAATAPISALRGVVDEVARENGPANPYAIVREHTSSSDMQASSSRGWAMAASVALLLSLAGNALLYSRWQEADTSLVALQNDQARLAATTQVVEQQLGEVRQENSVLRSDEFKTVALAGTPKSPSAKVRVLFNPGTQQVYLDVQSLPELPEGKEYQLWALDNGKPVDAGMLASATVSGANFQRMKDIASAQAFAMTIEPVGGSASPTLESMTVVGNI